MFIFEFHTVQNSSRVRQMAAYPDPPPVVPVPDTGVAQVTTSPGRGLLVAVSWRTKTKMTEFRTWVSSGPKCFQVLGLSPSLLQNPILGIGGPQ